MIPDNLSQSDRESVRLWATKRRPDLIDRLDDLEDDMLDWHRALPVNDKRTRRASWAATLRNWLRRQPRGAPVVTVPRHTQSRPERLRREQFVTEISEYRKRKGWK